MSTIKERFEAKFSTFVVNESSDILSFLKQELLQLVHEIEHKKVKPNEFLSTAPLRAGQIEIAYNNALSVVGDFIRSQINELE